MKLTSFHQPNSRLPGTCPAFSAGGVRGFGVLGVSNDFSQSITCSLVLPSFCCIRPSSSSSLPSSYCRSSSVRLALACLILPFHSFHLPFNSRLSIKIVFHEIHKNYARYK